MSITVKSFQIFPLNFSCGDVVREPKSGRQFAIIDYSPGVVTLQELRDEERNKSQFCDGTVVFFDERDFREPGDADPSTSVIASQILGELDSGDPEDCYSDNYISGLS